MKRLAITTLLVLLCSIWAVAQSYPSGSTATPSSSGQTTVKGCLGGSAGAFTLTDKSGTTYKLTGDTAKLSDHVGHEIQVKGTTTEPGTPSATSGAGAEPSLDVSSFKHISETCNAKSKSDSEKPMTEKPPMSEKPTTLK